jgi:hypothetical protein
MVVRLTVNDISKPLEVSVSVVVLRATFRMVDIWYEQDMPLYRFVYCEFSTPQIYGEESNIDLPPPDRGNITAYSKAFKAGIVPALSAFTFIGKGVNN